MPTNFPHGVMSMGALVGPTGIPAGGTHYWVKPYSGSNGNTGLSPDQAVKTLAYALSLATADKNDVVHLVAESNTAASTTDYQSSTLDWNKDMVHLVGECSGPDVSHRARIAFISTYVTASNLITVSADGCLFANIQFFAGVADANPTGCMKVTGDRNKFYGCHIAGIGNDSNDIANAYSLYLNTASENVFERCTIGLTTIGRGSAANHEILMSGSGGANSRTRFKDCMIVGWCNTAGNYVFVKAADAYAAEDWLIFDGCMLINPSTSKAGGAIMTSAFNIDATINGVVVLHNTTIVGAGNVNTADIGIIWCGAGTLVYTGSDVTDLGLALATTNA